MIQLNKPLVLASQSPRRRQLLADLRLEFETCSSDVEEVFPPEMDSEEVPVFLAQLKASAVAADHEGKIVIGSDSVVILDDEILGKPADAQDAIDTLTRLSGRENLVRTGVSLQFYWENSVVGRNFGVNSLVHFKELSKEQIEFYVHEYQPLDKAGSYAIQEWIGMVGISGIEGCYFNIMGLPLSRLYDELIDFDQYLTDFAS